MVSFRRLSFYSVTLGSILVLNSFAAAQDNSVRKELEALDAKRDEAYKRKDAGFIISLLAEDYSSKDLDGKVKNQTTERPWIKYTSPEGGYSALLPAQPTLDTEQS